MKDTLGMLLRCSYINETGSIRSKLARPETWAIPKPALFLTFTITGAGRTGRRGVDGMRGGADTAPDRGLPAVQIRQAQDAAPEIGAIPPANTLTVAGRQRLPSALHVPYA